MPYEKRQIESRKGLSSRFESLAIRTTVEAIADAPARRRITAADGGWTLIDSGLPLSVSKIKNWAESKFGKGSKPRAIVLTHGHFDHVGTAKDLLEEWNVPAYAHPAELPYLNGQIKYPPPDPSAGGGLMAVMSPLFPRTSADIRTWVQPLPADGSVPTLPGWRWIHTPGHAPGHVSLFREQDIVLLPGDAFCTTNQSSFLAVANQTPELNGPPAYYTPDWEAARNSVQALAALRPRTIAPGHGSRSPVTKSRINWPTWPRISTALRARSTVNALIRRKARFSATPRNLKPGPRSDTIWRKFVAESSAQKAGCLRLTTLVGNLE
ncbi:MAG: MBL fold metallo-hydrolase [Acidobacteriota bacterium]|nr:MBL fold metallo-hydrolase [Acidobacteriota bacterium]